MPQWKVLCVATKTQQNKQQQQQKENRSSDFYPWISGSQLGPVDICLPLETTVCHSWGEGCYWHLADRGQGCCQPSCKAMTVIHNKEWPRPECQAHQDWEILPYLELHEDRAGNVVYPVPPTLASVPWCHGIPCIELLEAIPTNSLLKNRRDVNHSHLSKGVLRRNFCLVLAPGIVVVPQAVCFISRTL